MNYGWIQSKLTGKVLPKKGKMLVMIHIALQLKRVQEAGNWHPDVLEWAEDGRLFDDIVAVAEVMGEDAMDGWDMGAD